MTSETKENHPTTNGTDGVEAITDSMQATSIEDSGRKVFVGNLNFVTREDQLREIFSKHGTIDGVQIILRGSRSMGYGFVTYATAEEAEKAVESTDKIEVDGRTINVEIAKPTPAGKAYRGQANGDKKSGDEENEGESRGPKARRWRGRGRWRGGARSGRSRRPPNGNKSDASVAEDHGATTDTSAQNDDPEINKATSRRSRSRRGKGTRGEGRPRRVGPPEGPPSKTLLFVGNLSFGLTDEAFKDFFSSYSVVSAHIVRRRYGSTQGKSKGFGFVDFADEESQQKALEENQGKLLDGRELQIKVAINETKKEEASASGEGWDVSNNPTAS
ncbi:hypothetical protein BY996DRAFT_7165007 [Phakopsora pachyrhizi]|uniref:RRM domain-containing protein n=1 Tax=Phakopsora pachyrhizi TaxID=170000 RepID=A0AAV0AXQ6_PHAPC|nr:hypothetical protein BY996DRAFT_7165007 [Phakopsora pachyrhizi]CAH7674182.1 hypothetical protein PPACK8108_LOCUS9092 [Phakopsora pachyrhizi]